MILRKTFRFEASHILPKHPGKCSRLHGHSWVLHVFVEGKVNRETGFVMDFADISKTIKPLIERLDHRHLGTWGHILTDVEQLEDKDHHNDWFVPGMSPSLYPSSENLLWWIAGELVEPVPSTWMIIWPWSKLAIEETCTSYAELSREEFDATRDKS